jgi:hypothetical protein
LFFAQCLPLIQKKQKELAFLPSHNESGILFNYFPSQKKIKSSHTATLTKRQ